MTKRPKDSSRTAAKQVAKVTRTTLPKGEDLLGSPELKAALAKAKSARPAGR